MALRPRVVPARGRPGNICKPCWRALPAPMSLYALTRTLRTSCYREQKLVQGRRALNVCALFVHAVRPWRRRPWADIEERFAGKIQRRNVAAEIANARG